MSQTQKRQGAPTPEETLHKTIALCHDAAELSDQVAKVMDGQALTASFRTVGQSYRETAALLEGLIGRKSDTAGTSDGATDRVVVLAWTAFADDTFETLIEHYQKALDRDLTGFQTACDEGELPAPLRDPVIRRIAAHEFQHKQLMAAVAEPARVPSLAISSGLAGDEIMSVGEQADALNEIIALCRDGIEFYEEAARRIDHPGIGPQLMNMAQLRQETIAELAPLVEAGGEDVQTHRTLDGITHQLLAGLHANLSQDDTAALLGQLEELENRTITKLQDIVENRILPRTTPDETWNIVRNKLRLVKPTHGQIASLRQAL